MFSEFDVVKLKHPLPGLEAGTIGTVVMAYNSIPRGYEVEFADAEGITIALLTLHDQDLMPVDTDVNK
jgi:hypothetical protein